MIEERSENRRPRLAHRGPLALRGELTISGGVTHKTPAPCRGTALITRVIARACFPGNTGRPSRRGTVAPGRRRRPARPGPGETRIRAGELGGVIMRMWAAGCGLILITP
jgi:hypothetical protein